MDTPVKKVRKQEGLTQVQVADKAGITETSYQRIEYGKQRPSLITAQLIAEALHTTVEKIFPLSQLQLGREKSQPDGNPAEKNNS